MGRPCPRRVHGMRQLEVRVLGDAEFKEWDALVADSAQGTVFHTSDWLVGNALLLDQGLILLGCYDGEGLIGGCPLYLSRPYRFLHVASSKAVSTPYGGMVISKQGKPPPITEEYLRGMLDLIRARGIGEMRVACMSSGEIAAAEVPLGREDGSQPVCCCLSRAPLHRSGIPALLR